MDAITINKSIDLHTVLSQYSDIIQHKESEIGIAKIKNYTSSLAMNIIAISVECAHKVTEEQINAIKDFSERFSILENDLLVKFTTYITKEVFSSENLPYMQIFHDCPKEIQDMTFIFQGVPTLCSLSEGAQKNIATQAFTRILETKTNGNFVDFDVLTKCMEIALVSTAYLNPLSIPQFIHQIADLVKLPNCINDFRNLATVAVKHIEDHLVPQELQNSQFFHGDILSKGYDQLVTIFKDNNMDEHSKKNPTNMNLLDFAVKYCRDSLKSQEYLIRNSSSAIPQKDQEKTVFTFTITLKDLNKPVSHFRIAHEKYHSGNETLWVMMPGQNQQTFYSLASLLRSLESSKNLKPRLSPAADEMQRYVQSAYIHS